MKVFGYITDNFTGLIWEHLRTYSFAEYFGFALLLRMVSSALFMQISECSTAMRAICKTQIILILLISMILILYKKSSREGSYI